jgi:2-oxoglutarate dehydrogenase E1 component
MDEQTVQSLMEERTRRYENALLGARQIVSQQGKQPQLPAHPPEPDVIAVFETGVDQATLRSIAQTITTVPLGFNLNPKIVGLLARRAKMVEGSVPVDWATAEALAFGSLLAEGASVRLTGQDTVRGTFSQRHAAFADTITGEEWTPLTTLTSGQARFRSAIS